MNSLNRETRQSLFDLICGFMDEPLGDNCSLCLHISQRKDLSLGCIYVHLVVSGCMWHRFRLTPDHWKFDLSSGVQASLFHVKSALSLNSDPAFCKALWDGYNAFIARCNSNLTIPLYQSERIIHSAVTPTKLRNVLTLL